MPEDIIPSTFNRSYSITADFDPSDGDTTEGVSRRPHRGRRGPARGDRSRDQRVLVLDEAVAALDVSIQAQILNLLADVREATGISYVFITHDLAVVRQVSYSIVVQSGRIVERGRQTLCCAIPNISTPVRLWTASRARGGSRNDARYPLWTRNRMVSP